MRLLATKIGVRKLIEGYFYPSNLLFLVDVF